MLVQRGSIHGSRYLLMRVGNVVKNAYKVKIRGLYGVLTTFNVDDFPLYFDDEELREISFSKDYIQVQATSICYKLAYDFLWLNIYVVVL